MLCYVQCDGMGWDVRFLILESTLTLHLSVAGNDFLPHLPSLDIRDGALDFLFNVYKRVLPTLGDYITNHGGEVNLSHVDVILAEVGGIEDYVFSMKHQNEQNDKKRRDQFKERKKHLTKNGQAPLANHPGGNIVGDVPQVKGRAARILEQGNKMAALGNGNGNVSKHKSLQENAEVAAKLKASMSKNDEAMDDSTSTSPLKRKAEEINPDDQTSKKGEEDASAIDSESQLEETETSQDDTEEVVVYDQAKLDVASKVLKQKMKLAEQKKLNDFAANVDDKVRLHEKGWKVRVTFPQNSPIYPFHCVCHLYLLTNTYPACVLHLPLLHFVYCRIVIIPTNVKLTTLQKMEVENICFALT
jgi:5'-3' exonuclease